MAVYKDLRFLDLAVDSVLQQTFRDLEFIIVDDGNAQDAVFEALARRDPRIRIVSSDINLGVAAALNLGIAAARADVIVRIDADDIAGPERLARLLAAFAEDSELGLVGSAVILIDEEGNELGIQQMPETDIEIRWGILFQNPFYHSAVAFRRHCFDLAGGYRPHELVSQDHYLWHDMLPFCRARNLAEPLARYRINSQGLVLTHTENSRARTHAIREARWAGLGLTYDIHDQSFGLEINGFLYGGELAPGRRMEVYRVILKVLRAFLDTGRPFRRADDRAAACKLPHAIVARMLARPPIRLTDVLVLCRLCFPFERSAAVRAAARRFVIGITSRSHRLFARAGAAGASQDSKPRCGASRGCP